MNSTNNETTKLEDAINNFWKVIFALAGILSANEVYSLYVAGHGEFTYAAMITLSLVTLTTVFISIRSSYVNHRSVPLHFIGWAWLFCFVAANGGQHIEWSVFYFSTMLGIAVLIAMFLYGCYLAFMRYVM